MAFNGSGVFSRLFSWVTDANNGLDISSSRMDQDSNDIASGLSNCICKDGQTTVTADIPFSSHKLTGVANGVARTDAATVGQVQDGAVNWVVAGGTADALTATYSPAITSLTDGQFCYVRATAANATTTPTFAPNGLTAHTITKLGGTALVAGDIAGNLHELILRYNLANTRWELLNPAKVSVTASELVLSQITNSLGADVSLTSTSTYFDGPSVAQGTAGTWFASGGVMVSGNGSDIIRAKLWDGTTLIASAAVEVFQTPVSLSLSGIITSPAGNIRISVKNATSTTLTAILHSDSDNSKDATISAFRIG